MSTAHPPGQTDLLQAATPGQPCPRCGEPFPTGSFWEKLREPEGRRSAWRLRHQRADGRWCAAYSGEQVSKERERA